MTILDGGVAFKIRAHTLPTKESSHASHETKTSGFEQCLWQDKDSDPTISALELVSRQEPLATYADSRNVNTIRGLVLDRCQQWKIGYGGKYNVLDVYIQDPYCAQEAGLEWLRFRLLCGDTSCAWALPCPINLTMTDSLCPMAMPAFYNISYSIYRSSKYGQWSI